MTAVCMTLVRGVGKVGGYSAVSVSGRLLVPATIGGDRRRVIFRDGKMQRDGDVICVLATDRNVDVGSVQAVPLESLFWMTPDGKATMGREVSFRRGR